MERVFFILIFLGFGVTLSTQKARFHAEFTQQKCFIDEIKNLINIEYCSELDVSDNTVRHQGVCTAKNGKVVYTCQHGHWSGTDSSVASLHRKKRFFKRLFRAVACFFFCKSGGEGENVIKYPPTFPDPCTPNDIQSNYNIDAGDDSVVVRWTVPKATDRDGGTPSVTQVGGGRNGGQFDGATYGKTHYITYRATDSDGLTGHCFFSFTVTGILS